ncbi:MAG: methyltransferase domain-containing protein [Rhodothermia bacterium]|nr:methyltransferase domain-containing protein [Rhodothermia bacterium]
MQSLLKKRIRKLLTRFMRGKRYSCPICGGSFRWLLPGGANKRPNAQCPSCGSLERHRTFWLFIQQNPLKAKTLRVLHFAPEPCFESIFRSWKQWTYQTADLYYQPVDLILDLENIALPNSCIDLVVCHHVLPEIPNDLQALTEIFRILAPQGTLLMQNPYHPTQQKTLHAKDMLPEERQKKWGKYAVSYQHEYGKDFLQVLEKVGFNTTIITPNDFCTQEDINLFRLGGTLFVCTKL